MNTAAASLRKRRIIGIIRSLALKFKITVETSPLCKLRITCAIVIFNSSARYFFTTTAMQLISTSEFPGSAATATVVRAGPPFGK